MKKKFFAVALATTMALSTAMTASAETASELSIDAAFSANTGDEAVSGEFDVTYTFKNASKDTSLNWNNFAVEVFDADGNYITVRADAFGVGAGTGAYNDALGTWGQESKMTWTGAPATEEWAAWAAGMADADVIVNVKRTGNVVTFTYDIKSSGGEYKMVGTTPEISNLASDLSVHITGEKVDLKNVVFKNNAAANDEKETPAPSDEKETPAPEKDTTPKTGDAAPVVALAAVAVLASAAVVVSRKKVTE